MRRIMHVENEGRSKHNNKALETIQKQDARLPPRNFATSNLVEGAFQKDESVLFSKYSASASFSLIFPLLIFFKFEAKNK